MGTIDTDSGVMFGRYRLLKRLATGGMGEIFLAEMDGAAGITKKVVIKRILPHLAKDPRFVERFLDEGRIVAQLSHSSLVPVFEVGSFQDQYFMAMEYVEGVDMEALRRHQEKLGDSIAPAAVATIMHKVARGLDYVHSRTDDDGELLNIVHRDISPHNIMATASGDVKILDFGIARARTRHHQSMPGFLAGKLPYMAPEQIRSGETNPGTDIYALGAVIYELISGHPPHKARDEQSLMREIASTPARPIRESRANVPPEFAAVIDQCVAHLPNERFPTAVALTTGLEHAIRADGLHGGEALLRTIVSRLETSPTISNSFDEILLQQLDEDLGNQRASSPSKDGTRPVSDVDRAAIQDLAFANSETELPETVDGATLSRGFKRWMAVAAVFGVLTGLIVMLIVDRMQPPASSASIPPPVAKPDTSTSITPPSTDGKGATQARDTETSSKEDAKTRAKDSGTPDKAVVAAAGGGPNPANKTDVRATPDVKTTTVKAPPQKTSVQLNVFPTNAKIFVRNRRVGTGKRVFTGVRGRTIRAQVRAPGYQSQSLRLVLGSVRSKTIRLKKLKTGTLTFRFFPARSVLYLDGEKMSLNGRNRFKSSVSVGQHKLRLVDPATKIELRRTVKVEEGRPTELGTLEIR